MDQQLPFEHDSRYVLWVLFIRYYLKRFRGNFIFVDSHKGTHQHSHTQGSTWNPKTCEEKRENKVCVSFGFFVSRTQFSATKSGKDWQSRKCDPQ